MVRYTKPKDGDWIRPQMQGYRLGCCDCGLVHDFDFKIEDKSILFRAFRNERATAAKRRERRKKTKDSNVESSDA